MQIRDERRGDADPIRAVIASAFASAPHSSGTEAAIVDALRGAGALTLSLVAEAEGSIVGHVAFSPVTISDGARGWFGLGPVAVSPDRQQRGVGQALIHGGLDRLVSLGARGCVVLGEPAYYARFGFRNDPALTYPGVPAEYFQRLSFTGAGAAGMVSYQPAFGAS